MDPVLSALLCAVFLVPVYLTLRLRRQSTFIRGPPSDSWLFGNEKELRCQQYAGVAETKWTREYGNVVSVGGCYGREELLVVDPKALHHIIHSAGYRFPKSDDMNNMNLSTFGAGIVSVEGETHRRQRRILNAAFSMGQLKNYMTLIQSEGEKMCDHLKTEAAGNNENVVNIAPWISKAALDIAGLAFFRYHFGVLDGREGELRQKISNIAEQALAHPTPAVTLFAAAWRVFPAWLLRTALFLLSSGTQYGTLHEFQKTSKQVAAAMIVNAQNTPQEKDIVGVLASSLASTIEKNKMSNDEVLSQMGTFITAAQDTTSASIAFLINELATHPADQARLRTEIHELFARKQGEPLTTTDYDGLPFLNACIKEGLRLHPIALTMLRKVSQDDVLPLSEPLELTNGQTTFQVPVKKGQTLICSAWAYNRLPKVWGDDAEQWNPTRFLEGRREADANVGVYSNLMSFSGGVRGCIGWRFALLELQTITTLLVRDFEFESVATIRDASTLITIYPVVEGKEGVSLPLKIKPL